MSTAVRTVRSVPSEHVSVEALGRARQDIELAASLGEVKAIRDRMLAFHVYAKQAGMSREIADGCAELKLRAERRAGRLLIEMGERGERRSFKGERRGKTTLADLGIDDQAATKWILEAGVPDDTFEGYLRHRRDAKKELTQSGLLKLARTMKGAVPAHAKHGREHEWDEADAVRKLRQAVWTQARLWPANRRGDFVALVAILTKELRRWSEVGDRESA